MFQTMGSSAGSVAVVHGLSCSVPRGILVPRAGIKPTSPAWEGGFLTTGPLRKLFVFPNRNPFSITGNPPTLLICLGGRPPATLNRASLAPQGGAGTWASRPCSSSARISSPFQLCHKEQRALMSPVSRPVRAKSPETERPPWFLDTSNRNLEARLFHLTCPLCGNRRLPVPFLTLQLLSY